MSLDYQSLIVVILVSTFGLMLVVVVKNFLILGIVLVLSQMHFSLLLLLAMTTIVNQLIGTIAILFMAHTFSMTLYGMEKDVSIIVVMTIPNLGSIVSWFKLQKVTTSLQLSSEHTCSSQKFNNNVANLHKIIFSYTSPFR